MTRPRVSVELVRGDRALARLDDTPFVAAWEQLRAACSWATAFQSLAFADAWYRLHATPYEPIVVEGRDEQGDLVGLLLLARRRTGRVLVGAGDFHAEYQTWIATDAAADAFARQAIDALQRAFPRGRLHLTYLPAGAPLGWVAAASGWPRRIQLRRRLGGFIDLTDRARLDASLRKGHNRNRLNSLRRIGEVRLETIATVDELRAVIDEIAILCDIRQGAVNDSLPFTNNPLKLPLHVELMRKGLLRATILRVGQAMGSAHLDMINGDDVLNYLTAYAPALSRQSPGSLHTLMLAQQLADDGVKRYDLSPGGGYKDRYATDQVEVHRMTVQFGLGDRILADAADRAVRVATAALSAVGQTPRTARERVRRLRSDAAKRLPGHRAGPPPSSELVVFRLPPATGDAPADRLALDDLGSLLGYRPERWWGGLTVSGFLQIVLHRLEIGHHALTRSDGTTLTECWWLCRLDAPGGSRPAKAPADLGAAETVLVYGNLIEAGPDAVRVPGDGVAERIAGTLHSIAPAATVLLAAAVDDAAVIEAVERAGGVRLGTVRPKALDDASGEPSDQVRVAQGLAEARPADRSRAG